VPNKAKNRLIKIHFFLALIVIGGIAFSIYSSYFFQKELEKAIYLSVYNEAKKRLKNTTDFILADVQTRDEQLEEDLKNRVREEVLNAYKIAESIYKGCRKAGCSNRKTKELIKSALKKYRFLDGMGYIFIDSVKGPVILNPAFPEVEGKSLWNWKDKKGKFVHREFERVVLYSPNHEGFVSYYWYLPGTREVDKKISFVKLFKPFNWIIGGGVYLKQFKEKYKETLKAENAVYNVFIIDLNDKIPREFSFVKGIPIEKLKKGIFLEVKDKTYYLRYYPDWNWIIGSYITANDILKQVLSLKNSFLTKFRRGIALTNVFVILILIGSGGAISYYIQKMLKALKQLKEKERELLKVSRFLKIKAFKDDVTGLFNRKKLESDLEKIDPARQLNFALFNIRNFKDVNELFGFKEGDTILREFGKTLKRLAKKRVKKSNVYRIRGDKFGLLVCDIETSKFLNLVNELIGLIESKDFKVRDIEFRLDVVAGISNNRDNLLVEAEIAEQEAKKRKLDIFIFSGKLAETFEILKKNVTVITQVKKALEEERVIPVFQPIVDVNSGDIFEYEALIRVKDEEGNYINPGEFLPLAKKLALYKKLSKAVIEKAIKTAKEKDFRVSLNLSSEDIASEEMISWLLELVENEGMGEKISFEVVETEAFSDIKLLKSFHGKIKEIGASLAIDDFGSGYSNYEYIAAVKPDFIKIDGSLVSKLPESKEVRTLVKHIVTFCNDLNIKTVAEFVSSQEIYEIVKEIGVNYGQGFYLGKPEEIK